MELEGIDMERVPRHVAIIMDGNGRWAKQRGLPHTKGHEQGADSVRAVLEACEKLNDGARRIESLTLYAFSTENWQRPQKEVNTLFRLLSKNVRVELDELHRKGLRFRFIGRREGLSDRTLADLDTAMQRTVNNDKFLFNVAVNYGSRTEIVDACRKIVRDVHEGRLKESEIDERSFAQRLYAPETSDLDLLIRTSGEFRVSNFMLWQISYAEFVVSPVLWPDFRHDQFLDCIREYQQRTRRFGKR